MRHVVWVAMLAVTTLTLLPGCETTPDRQATSRVAASEPQQLPDAPGLHNLWEFAPGVYSGSMPHGDAGFDSLRALGIKTVLSVDGARPDLERATARDMRYVHVPIQYSGIDPEQRTALAQAIHDLPRPIYVHCHHGRHRGPAAAALGLICTDELTPGGGVELLKNVGTSPKYPGLYAVVGSAAPLAPEQLDALDAPLPAHAQVRGMVATMAAIDRIWDHLKAVRDADWQTPADHPDLVPLSEASRLHANFSSLVDDPDTRAMPPDFQALLQDAITHAAALQAAMEAGDKVEAGRQLELLAANCKACHVPYRNE